MGEIIRAEKKFKQNVGKRPGGNLTTISIIAALAGFIFGFDTVVISGANLPTRLLWHTSPWFHGFFIMSMALWGTVAGALFGGVPTDKFGRKKVLLWIGLLFSISSIGSALAPNPYIFSFFRFMGGLGIGISSVAAPTYISEISTPASRGRLGAMYQFNIVFGILVAFFSNYAFKGIGGADDWRWMLGIMAAPSLLYTLLVTSIPESPRWLAAYKQNEAAAAKVFQKSGVPNVTAQVENIKNGIQHRQYSGGYLAIFNRRYRRVTPLAFFIAFFNQWSGINFILYYAPEILQRAGVGSKDSLLNSIAIGGANLVFTFAGLYLIDRLGRKTLLLLGCMGYIVSLTLVSWAFYTHAGPGFLLSFLLLFIASHAVGQGAVIWVFLAEIFPDNMRAAGQSFGASVHWVFAAVITLITPVFLDAQYGVFKNNPWPIFAFFAVMMFLQLGWVWFKVPETKGATLEELEKKLVG